MQLFFFPSWASCTDAKRLIGRRFDDQVVQSDMKHWPFKVINDASRPKVQVEYKGETKTFFPEEISSMVLVKMKEIAEAYLGKVRVSLITWKNRKCCLHEMLIFPLFTGSGSYTCLICKH